MAALKYERMLLKISGEGLSGPGQFGLTAEHLRGVAMQITELVKMGVQPAIVVGAGNFIRGTRLSQNAGLQRVSADQMGMLATVINAIALQDVLEDMGTPSRVLSAVGVSAVCEPFIRRRAIKHLEAGRAVILAGGTGNPFFTTDTCAALRALELQVPVLIKATKVDGVYSADPVKEPDAVLYDQLTFKEVLDKELAIMDQSAFVMCRDNGVDIIVCNLMKSGTVGRVAQGERVGTLITGG